jgi:hypothetical protein
VLAVAAHVAVLAMLLAYAGRSQREQGFGSPVDLALYLHYLERLHDSIDPAMERHNYRALR